MLFYIFHVWQTMYICQTHVLGRFQTGFFVPERPCSDLDKTLPLLTPHLKEKVCLAAKTIILDILSRHQISCVFRKVYATRDISCLQGGGGVVANWKCQILCCGQWPGFLLHPLILLWIYAYRPGKVQILHNRNWKDIRCELWLAFWWREVCGGDTRLPSLRPGPAPTAQVFSPCQPNPWVLDGCSYLRQKLRKNGFGLLLPSKNLPAPILPLSHLLCIGRLPTETKYCPNSYWWPGRISNHQWQPWSHPDFEQDIELGGTTPLSQASQILRDQGAQFSK